MDNFLLRQCWLARALAVTHGVFYTAAFLHEQSIPLNIALEFLTLPLRELSLMYRPKTNKQSN